MLQAAWRPIDKRLRLGYLYRIMVDFKWNEKTYDIIMVHIELVLKMVDFFFNKQLHSIADRSHQKVFFADGISVSFNKNKILKHLNQLLIHTLRQIISSLFPIDISSKWVSYFKNISFKKIQIECYWQMLVNEWQFLRNIQITDGLCSEFFHYRSTLCCFNGPFQWDWKW